MKRIVVPVEPTAEMEAAARTSDREYTDTNFGKDASLFPQGGYDHYVAMLAATPPYEPSEAEIRAVNKVLTEWQFPADGSIPDKIRAALIAADEARRS